jgi:hypothetical protein
MLQFNRCDQPCKNSCIAIIKNIWERRLYYVIAKMRCKHKDAVLFETVNHKQLVICHLAFIRVKRCVNGLNNDLDEQYRNIMLQIFIIWEKNVMETFR